MDASAAKGPENWHGEFVVCDPDFNVEALLKGPCARHAHEFVADDLFSPSPHSTLETSPASNPQMAPVEYLQDLCEDSEDFEDPKLRCETPAECRKRRKKEKGHAHRKKQRVALKSAETGGPAERQETHQKYFDQAAPLYTETSTAGANVASTGYTGLNKTGSKHAFTLEQLLGKDYQFKLQKWDGRTPMAVIDVDGRIIVILAGHPEDSPELSRESKWEAAHKDAAEALKDARTAMGSKESKKQSQHRRGNFSVLRCGVSHGGGQTHPMNFGDTEKNKRILQGLNNRRSFRRIAGFGSSVLQSWAPKLHKYYSSQLGQLFKNDPSLKRPFNSVFTAATYNLGPNTSCFPHIDFANLPFGFCAITALGDFDPTRGGHLVLWECKLVIEFPPGSTILLPSAIITHSNTPVADGKQRFSFTQYSAGALFRWVDRGFQTSSTYCQSLNQAGLKEMKEMDQNRWKFGLELLPGIPFVCPYH